MSAADPNQKLRVSADLPVGTVELLRQLAERQNITLTDALRRAIATESLIQERIEKNGVKVLLEDPDGRTSEVIFRR
jgi:hypothetical protein